MLGLAGKKTVWTTAALNKRRKMLSLALAFHLPQRSRGGPGVRGLLGNSPMKCPLGPSWAGAFGDLAIWLVSGTPILHLGFSSECNLHSLPMVCHLKVLNRF